VPYSQEIVGRRSVTVLALLALAAVAFPASASAHARLLRTTPHDRVVLARAPAEVRLRFDAPVRALGGMRAIRNGSGRSVLAGRPRAQGRDLVVPLARIGDGDYTVLWRVLSDDGHLETGVLAFGVGDVGRPPPSPELRAGGTLSARDLVSRFLVFAGLLLAAGTAVFRLLVWRTVERHAPPPHELALLLAGFALVFAGGSGLTGHGLPFNRFGIAYGILIALAVCGAVAGAISKVDPPVRWLALGLALACVPLPSVAGHALEDGRLRAPELLLDVVHLLAASVWAGGVASLLTSFRGLDRTRRDALVRRFSSIALDAVILLAASGLARAIGELRAVAQLWTTSYGVTLLVKTGLFAALVLLGAVNRRWLIPAGSGAALRRALRAELVLLGAAVAAVAFLTASRPGRTITAAQQLRGPVTLPGREAVVVSGQARGLALGLALSPAGGSTRLLLSVLGPLGQGVDGLEASLRLPGRTVSLSVCGSGCYGARASIHGGEHATLLLGSERVALVLPSPRAPVAAALLAKVARRYDGLRSVVIDERLSSGVGATVVTRYELQAPSSFAYRIARGGPQAVVLGARRWDRESAHGTWVETPQTPLPQPRVWWGPGATNAHVVGHARVAGRPVTVVTLLQRSLPGWFTVWIDERRSLPLALRMVTTAHFMHHRYSGFDRPLQLRPPVG
jgi:copper transport protein